MTSQLSRFFATGSWEKQNGAAVTSLRSFLFRDDFSNVLFNFFFSLFWTNEIRLLYCAVLRQKVLDLVDKSPLVAWYVTSYHYFLSSDGFCTLESVQDFLIKLDIKPLMHLLEISTFSLNNVIVRLTKVMNRADKNWAQF